MNQTSYTISLHPDEEKIAQLLTRDAWGFFSSMISHRDLFHVKEIPMMPRRGAMEIVNDAEILQYYVDYAHQYVDEMLLMGWEVERTLAAADSLVHCIEQATGIQRGLGMVKFGS